MKMVLTSASLLNQLRQPEAADAWARFVKLYTPLLYHWAKQMGVTRSEADDLVQDVFATLVQELPKFVYDPDRRFRAWLREVASHKWRELVRRRGNSKQQIGVAGLEDPTCRDPARDFWELEYRALLVGRALQLMREDFPRTWQPCWLVLTGARSVADVAREFDMTSNALYQAKFKIVCRLRQELADLLE